MRDGQGLPCRLVAVIALLWSLGTAAAEPAVTFNPLETRDGLPAQDVRAVAQDSAGFLWFGTNAGLARFDGMRMRSYHHAPGSPGTLAGDDVADLLRDSTGRLWVATDGGLCQYRAASDDFACATGAQGELRAMTSIAQAADGALWLGGDGIVHFDPSTGTTRRVEQHSASGLPAGSRVLDLLVDANGILWVGTARAGLWRVDPRAGSFAPVLLGPTLHPQDAGTATVRAVYADRRRRIWVATDGGLTRLDEHGGIDAWYGYDFVDPGNPHALSDNRVSAVFEDADGVVWVGTRNHGINRYDESRDCFRRYRVRAISVRDADDDPVGEIFQDDTGLLWIAGHGVQRLDPASERVLRHRPAPVDPAAGTASRPEQLAIDAAGVVWLGGGGGLVRYDPAHDDWSRFLVLPEDVQYDSNRVRSLLVAAEPFRYVGAADGIWLFREDKQAFGGSYITAPATPRVLLIDRGDILWAGTARNGLVRYGGAGEPDQIRFRHDPADAGTLSSDSVQALHEDASGGLWIGTPSGLDRFDRASGAVQRITVVAAPAGPASLVDVRAIAESGDGALWLGTGGGLRRFDPARGALEDWGTAAGLPHPRVNAVVVDRAGSVWAGTDAGLARLEPSTGRMRVLHHAQGLPDDQVLQLALAPDGGLWVATYAGLVSLRPEDFGTEAHDSRVGIAGIDLLGAPLPPARRADDTHIRLGHADRVLGIDLAVFDFRDPSRNRLAWRLDGVDADWVYAAGGQRRASYTTLPPGEYAFRYRGMDASGRWHDAVAPLHLTVLPAPWATPWAMAAYVLALFATVLGYAHLRARAATVRAAALETTVQERTTQLQEQRDRVVEQGERLRQAIDAKDRLYANVSHEFRTPLTVILGPVERLLGDESSPGRRQHLEVVRRNAQRLLRLVEQIMTLARIDARHGAQAEVLRLDSVVNTLVQSFTTLADDRGVAFGFRATAPAWVACERDALERIAINLISNAIKYTPGGGRVAVSVETPTTGTVELVVQDTGIGIPAAEQAAVFERFYRVGDAQERATGSGLGLALVKELAAVNDARVTLDSVPGEGTTVRVAFRTAPAPAGAPEAIEDAESQLAELEAASAAAADQLDALEQGKASMQNILVIEDNADLCWHLSQVLGEQFQCSFARDGEAGVEQAIELIPDLVICDVMLPKLNGFEVTRRIKEDERTSHVPVILLTARSDEQSRIAGLQSLADEYVTKPFSDAELRQRVDTLLSIREILRERYAREARRLTPDSLPDEIGARDRRFLARVDKALVERYADPEFSMAEFAGLVAMSERQMQRKLKALTNQAPREYLRSYRLARAVEMLKTGEPAGTVAYAVGFASQSYFTSCFKAEYGVTPGQVGGTSPGEAQA